MIINQCTISKLNSLEFGLFTNQIRLSIFILMKCGETVTILVKIIKDFDYPCNELMKIRGYFFHQKSTAKLLFVFCGSVF